MYKGKRFKNQNNFTVLHSYFLYQNIILPIKNRKYVKPGRGGKERVPRPRPRFLYAPEDALKRVEDTLSSRDVKI